MASLPPLYSATIGDLSDAIVVTVECQRCGHSLHLLNGPLKAGHPADRRILDVRFRCGECGGSGKPRLHARPTGEQFGGDGWAGPG